MSNLLPTVSFIIPHLGTSLRRSVGLQRCIDSIYALKYPQELIDVKVVDGPETVPQKVKWGVDNSHGTWICYMANDTIMSPDSLKIALTAAKRAKVSVVAFHDAPVYPDLGNVACHFIIKRDFIPRLKNGEVFLTRFHHVGCDNFLHAQAQKMGEFLHCEEAVIEHNHFSKDGQTDEVYTKGWSKVNEDRAILAEELALL